MLKVFGGGKRHAHTKSLNALEEVAQLEDAMAAVTYIMADDVDGAEEHLSKGTSPFHLLGMGVVKFIKATLGFEQEVMREASSILADAENAAYESQKHAHRMTNAYHSPIFPAGTEYAVCLAQAQLMSAIVGVLNESLTEAVKSFYKLRKAYMTLDSVMAAENKFLQGRSTSSLGSFASNRPASRNSMRSATHIPADIPVPEKAMLGTPTSKAAPKTIVEDDDDDLDFVDADEEHHGQQVPTEYAGHLDVPAERGENIKLDTAGRTVNLPSSTAAHLPDSHERKDDNVPNTAADFEQLTFQEKLNLDEDISQHLSHPVDIFVVSGANFCFGILLLMMSMVPPAFATLLKIVGFKGDRDRGMKMLWQASQYENINGAMSSLVVFEYLNGLAAYCDIILRTGEGSFPKERCRTLLREMRSRYPKSHLFLLGESRMFSSDKELEKAVDWLETMGSTELRQVEALRWFQRSLLSMFLHRYEDTTEAYLKSVGLNNWSHGLYYYTCGAAHVELYRRTKISNPEAAQQYAKKARDFFDQVAPNAGKKKFMARQLPFDIFITRKINKWESRAQLWGCDLMDAIGVSPLEEMIYFWNGYKIMRSEHLDVSLANLAWSESEANPYWSKESHDERGILALLRAAALRCKGDTECATEVLQSEILAHDRSVFKGELHDAWTAPCARYEMAANLWLEADRDGRPEEHTDVLERCKKYLQEVSSWESYDLDARIGLKVTAAKGTLRRLGLNC